MIFYNNVPKIHMTAMYVPVVIIVVIKVMSSGCR